MIVKNLRPIYYDRLLAIPIDSFKHLCNAGTQIENAILDGKIGKEEPKTWKRGGNSGGGNVGGGSSDNNNAGNKVAQVGIEVNAVNGRQFPIRQNPRTYTELGISLSSALKNLTKSGKLKPLEQRPLPYPIPPNWNMNEYCHFHQRAGHSTDRCGRLRNEIQDLIEASQKPNTTQNPLPNHQEKPNYQAVPPPLFLNMISIDEPMIAPITTPHPIFEVDANSDSEDEKFWSWGRKGGTMVKADYWYESDAEDVAHLTKGGRHFKPSELEVDHPRREVEEDRKKEFEKKMEEKDDVVLKQLKRSKADISIWGLLMASYGHRKALLEALSKQNVAIKLPLKNWLLWLKLQGRLKR